MWHKQLNQKLIIEKQDCLTGIRSIINPLGEKGERFYMKKKIRRKTPGALNPADSAGRQLAVTT